jgi:hypothetical protein
MTNYDELAGESRAWVFQANKELSEEEQKSIAAELTDFVDKWLSHGSLLKAHFKLLHNRFIVFFVDEEGDRMCGRAVDNSVRFVKELEAKYKLVLLDRNMMAYIDGNGKVQGCKLADLSKLMEDGKINPETKVFNNLVQNKSEFDKNWIVPLSQSWHQNYITQTH